MAFKNKKNGKDISSDIQADMNKFKKLIDKDLGDEIADQGQQLIDKSFREERYQNGKSTGKWAARAKDPDADKSRNQRRALLVGKGTGNKLISNVKSKHLGKGEVRMSSDKQVGKWNLAEIHNEGLSPVPQRQLMPKPGEKNEALDNGVEKWLNKEMDKIFK